MANKEIWIRADLPEDKEVRKQLVLSALESGITGAIVRSDDLDFSDLGKITLMVNNKGSLGDGYELVELSSPSDQEKAMSMAGRKKGVVLDSRDWTIIPLENMIAKFHTTSTKVFACADTVEQAKLYMQTMERGVDGIVVCTNDPGSVRKYTDIIRDTGEIELSEVEIVGIRNIEMGDRVCVDTISNMVPGEGMLVGSQAACLFLVQSESEENGYVASRPFRVNAGAVHAYVLGPEGRTRYLGEYRSGDTVVLVDRSGATRLSSVGRCKVEIRPLILVTATDGERTYTTILQNAETVKLVTSDSAISVTKLTPGDKVLARLESGGRHFGMKIDETIREIR